MDNKSKILLSFDTEEFDVPREHGVNFSLEEGMKVSKFGTNRILDCLKQNQVTTGTQRLPMSRSRRKFWSKPLAEQPMAIANHACFR